MGIANKIENLKSIYWFIFNYHNFKTKLINKYSLQNIKPFKFLDWHHGAFYFTGKLKEKKIFIKTDFLFNLLENENTAFQIMQKNNMDNSLLNVNIFSKENNIIITDYANAIGFIDYMNSVDDSEKIKIINKLIEIVLNLKELKLIHRDIKLDNFLVLNGELKIIDFLFCMGLYDNKNKFLELSKQVKNSINILEGMNKNNKPAKLLWDDMYSLSNILTELQKDYKLNLTEQKKKIDCLVGKYTYKYE
jgi:serine/threonine protein kinase